MTHMKTAPFSLLFVLATLVIDSPAFGAIKTWDGSSNGAWGTGANWSGGTAPVAGDDLVFPAGNTRVIMSNTLAAATVLNSTSTASRSFSKTDRSTSVSVR